MIIKNVEVNFKKKIDLNKNDALRPANARLAGPLWVELTSNPNWPHNSPSGNNVEFRNKAIQKSSLVMYKKLENGKWHTINISTVPIRAIRYYLENKYKAGADLSIYDNHIFCEYDKDPNYSFEHRTSDSNNNESFLLDKIAERIKEDFLNSRFYQSYADELDTGNTSDGVSILQKYLEQYAFYFIYNSVNYKDAWVLFSPVLPKGNMIDNLVNNNDPTYNDYINSNKNFLFNFTSCQDYFLFKNKYIFTKNITTAFFESLTWDYNEYNFKRIKYISLYEASHGFIFDPNPYNIIFSSYPGYTDITVIEKDVYFIEASSEGSGNYTPIEGKRYIYRYLDSSENDKKKAIGFGFVMCEQNLLIDASGYASAIFTNFGGALQYVPFLTGLLRFLVAIKMGYKPLMYFVDTQPDFRNLITESIIRENQINTTYNDLLKKKYYKNFYIFRQDNAIKIKERGTDNEFEITYPIDLEKFNLRLEYLDIFPTEEFLDVFNSTNNFTINITFDYYTSDEMLPAFIESSKDNIIFEWTNEPAPITGYGGQTPPAFDYRYVLANFPYAIFYSQNRLKRPFVFKRMEVLERSFSITNNSFSAVLPEYKYYSIKDFLTSPPYANNPQQYFQNNVIPVDINGGKIEPPVFIIERLFPEDITNIKTFNLISSGRIMEYPSIYSLSSINTPIDADFYNTNLNLYYMEILYEKYLRAIILFSILYLARVRTNIFFNDFNLSIVSTRIDGNQMQIDAKLNLKTFLLGEVNRLELVFIY